MSSQTFTPTDAVDMKKERDWAANIGMMDWDSTNIVFTKRTLIEFLKYTGTTVDTNFMNISKLPRYAKFGKISQEPVGDAIDINAELESSVPASKEESNFRPSRRVKTAPGGPSSNLFEEEFGDDALSQAPSKSKAATEPSVSAIPAKADAEDGPSQPVSAPRPSRRVRTAPGGKDSLAEGLWGPVEPENTEFKPTRRVRQGPGGQDSVGGLFR